MKALKIFGSVLLGFIMLNSCSKKDDPAPGATLTTAAVSGITEISANVGGTVVTSGTSTITARGIVWGKATAPTLADSVLTIGSGTGDFSGTLNWLAPGTKYYARAYATNNSGTTYGNEVQFTTTSVLVADGLVAFYRFNNSLEDISGNFNDLSHQTNISYVNDRNAAVNGAVHFDGVTSRAYTSSFNFPSKSFSASFWVNDLDNTTTQFWFDMQGNSVLQMGEGAPNVNGYYTAFFGGPITQLTDAHTNNNNMWHHLVVTYDGTTASLYYDGSLSSSAAASLNSQFGLSHLFVGLAAGQYNKYDMDNLRIYSRALTAEEVTTLYGE